MEKKDNKNEEKKSYMTLDSRKKLTLTGVIEVLSFNEEQIILNTILGKLIIKGEGLKMNKLDVQNGDITVAGNINSYMYMNSKNSKSNDNIIKRLFR